MFKKILLVALLALPFTASLSQASSYIPTPDCFPCATTNYIPTPDCFPCVADNYIPTPDCFPCVAGN